MPLIPESMEMRPSGRAAIPQSPGRSRTLVKNVWAHLSLAWITILIATAFYVTTIIYSWHPGIFSRFGIIGRSPARALGFLTILVQLDGVFLAGAINHSLGVLLYSRSVRTGGISFHEYLALHAGTSFEGWAVIIGASPWPGWLPRAWSILRFLCIGIVPVLAIVITNNVETSLYFYEVRGAQPVRGYGIGEFNASLAIVLQPLADSFFSTRFKDFTSDSDISIDITQDTDRAACENSIDPIGRCRTTYFIPGGIQNGAPALLNNKTFTSSSSIQPILALNQTGYVFNFEDELNNNSTVLYEEVECVKFGFPVGAVRLCLKNRAAHEIQALLTLCPKNIAADFSCMNMNGSWPLAKNWSTTLSLTTRRANIGYNGQNGTILRHEFVSDNKNVSVNATEVNNVFGTLFNQRVNSTSDWGKLLQLLDLLSNKPVAPLIIWQHFQALTELESTNPRIRLQAFSGFHSLMAIPIYHCQPKDFADMRRSLLNQINNSTSLGRNISMQIINVLPDATADTEIKPAKVQWNLNVGRATLIAFIILNGVTLLACFVAHIWESFLPRGKDIQPMGTYPLFDETIDSEVRLGTSVYDLAQLRNKGLRKRLEETESLNVHLLSRRTPPPSRAQSTGRT